MSKDVVNDFVNAYAREFDYYQAAARLYYQRCEAILAARGIRAIVTYRAKRPSKLLAKLMQRDEQTGYGDSKQIRDDLADLAGVRIALYFPGDRDQVCSLISDSFDVEHTSDFLRLEKNFQKRDLRVITQITFACVFSPVVWMKLGKGMPTRR